MNKAINIFLYVSIIFLAIGLALYFMAPGLFIHGAGVSGTAVFPTTIP